MLKNNFNDEVKVNIITLHVSGVLEKIRKIAGRYGVRIAHKIPFIRNTLGTFCKNKFFKSKLNPKNIV